jgi:Staphylococcal nuclease homologue
MKRLLAVFGTLVMVFGSGTHLAYGQETPNGVPKSAEQAEVAGHVDGDKIKVKVGGNTEEVLFIGVDAPEPKKDDKEAECFAKESADRVKKLVPKGTIVYLERDQKDRDTKDRLLRYVWVPGKEKRSCLTPNLSVMATLDSIPWNLTISTISKSRRLSATPRVSIGDYGQLAVVCTKRHCGAKQLH